MVSLSMDVRYFKSAYSVSKFRVMKSLFCLEYEFHMIGIKNTLF